MLTCHTTASACTLHELLLWMRVWRLGIRQGGVGHRRLTTAVPAYTIHKRWMRGDKAQLCASVTAVLPDVTIRW